MTAAVVHGKRTAYVAGCRCGDCRRAHTVYVQRWKDQIRGALGPDDRRHGTPNGYSNYGCRCDRCRAANTDRARASRAKAADQ